MAWLWSFTRELNVTPLNDTDATAEFDLFDGDAVRLETMNILGRDFDAAFITAWLGQPFVDQITRDAQEWYLDGGWREFEEYCAERIADLRAA